ncbi:hypothetical protein E4U59_002607 [Claviceps monticola]|nr:hypothetical protein E4U59_002607 [Claviceps monticola]
MGPTRSRGAYRSRLFSHGTGSDALRIRKGFSDVYLDDAVMLLALAIALLGDSGDSGNDDAVDRPVSIRFHRIHTVVYSGLAMPTKQLPHRGGIPISVSDQATKETNPVANLERASNAPFPF